MWIRALKKTVPTKWLSRAKTIDIITIVLIVPKVLAVYF
jgi:hypothetical protein